MLVETLLVTMQEGMPDHPVGLFRLLYRLGVDDDCPIRLSAAKALGVEPPLGVISSIDPPCGPRASDTQRAARATSVDFLEQVVAEGESAASVGSQAYLCRQNCPAKCRKKRLVIGFQ